MSASLAVIVRCADALTEIFNTVRSLRRPEPAIEAILVRDPSTPAAALPWLEALAATEELRLVAAPRAEPGAVWNAGIAAATAPAVLCLDAGDRPSARYVSEGAARLLDSPDVAVVTTGVEVQAATGPRLQVPGVVDAAALCASFDAVDGASIFRHADWQRLGGFDETLPTLETCDLWLALLGDHGHAAIIPGVHVRRPGGPQSLHVRRWDEDLRRDAALSVVAGHGALFQRHFLAALHDRQLATTRLRARHAERCKQTADALAELQQTSAEVTALEARVPEERRQTVDLGDLRRVTPISQNWGYERGDPLDRHYIEAFLERSAGDIRGAVLEIQESDYSKRFGAGRVTSTDVLDLNPANPLATVIADLRQASNLPADRYDCIVLTQTLHVIDDMRAVLAECVRVLKPGGVLLATLASASRVCLEYGNDGDFWRVTEAGARRLFADYFAPDHLTVRADGNALTNAAFLFGLATRELTKAEFDFRDPYFPLVVTVRAVKAGTPSADTTARVVGASQRSAEPRAAVLMYHRVADVGHDAHGLCVSPVELQRQLGYLRERHPVISLSELGADLASGEIRDGAIVLTFDDTYLDNLTTARPILEAANVPATFFATTAALPGPLTYWWDRLEASLLGPGTVPPRLSMTLNGASLDLPTVTYDDRVEAHRTLYLKVVGLPAATRDTIVDEVERWSGIHVELPRRLDAGELRDLAGDPRRAIGAHGVHHLLLTDQPEADVFAEIDESARTLGSLLGAPPPTSFAYPFGGVSQRVAAVARQAGMRVAVTCESALVTRATDPLLVPRLDVRPGDLPQFVAMLERAGLH